MAGCCLASRDTVTARLHCIAAPRKSSSFALGQKPYYPSQGSPGNLCASISISKHYWMVCVISEEVLFQDVLWILYVHVTKWPSHWSCVQMCDLPFAFFSDPKLTPVLIVTLLAVCYGSERNRDVVQQELSMDMLLTFLKRSREKITQVTESENDTKPEDEEVVVKTKAKVSWGSESESGGASTARGRSRQKQPLPDVFFASPKRVNWNQTRNGVNINMTSSDGDIAAKETKSAVYRSGGRSTPITDLQTLPVKRSKGGSSSFLSSSLPSRFPTVSLPESAASGTNELLGDGMASFPFPAALTLQNRFPESLWTQAEEFFSPGSRMGRIFKA